MREKLEYRERKADLSRLDADDQTSSTSARHGYRLKFEFFVRLATLYACLFGGLAACKIGALGSLGCLGNLGYLGGLGCRLAGGACSRADRPATIL